jgi:hypothetical protein|tara:strand:- start:1710 stop:1865 length:156 start_codon:yes stop_codon:yes gene_type:complete
MAVAGGQQLPEVLLELAQEQMVRQAGDWVGMARTRPSTSSGRTEEGRWPQE